MMRPELGTRLIGHELAQAIAKQKVGHQATGAKARLWNASPLVDPRTGLYYPSAIISCPAPEQDGTRAMPGIQTIPASLSTGGIVTIKAGTREGGEFNRRVAVAGGRAIVGSFGKYHNVSIVTERVNNGTDSPIVFSWISGEAPGRSDELWEAPAFSDDGLGGKKFLPEGAVEVYSDTSVTMTYGIFVDGTERTVAVTTNVGVPTFVPNSATYFAASAACILYFRLAPL